MAFDMFVNDVELNTRKVSENLLKIKFIQIINKNSFFTVSALRSHVRECGIGAQCPLCPKIVTQRRNLAKHMEKHKRDGLWDSSQNIQFKLSNSTENFNIINIKDEISF